jgi:5-methylcytosine-specific restriction endonuclease McrA
MSNVFVLDCEQRPLDPIHPGYARWLLTHQKAAVFRRYPFTIVLRERKPDVPVQPLRLKIDPGSRTTGLALVSDASGDVVWAAELTHRGQRVRKHLADRRAVRRSRRQRKTRYRKPRFANRCKPAGWLPPSLESRIANIVTWVARLRRLCPLEALSQELVKFDTQLMEHPEIAGVEYQQGTLAGYETRAYLLEKWGRRCAYCKQTDVPLEIEHLTPKARGGSNRVSNLTLACTPCNQKKGTLTAAEFGFPELQALAKVPLKDAAAVNATRWALYERLKAAGLPLETGTGGRTKWNRTRLDLPKTHWLDAACVGATTPEHLRVAGVTPLLIAATGWGCRQMCLMDKPGFPRTRAKGPGRVRGFRTGDLVRAVVRTGTKKGTYVGRVAVRATGSFNVTTKTGTIQGIPVRSCQAIHRQDGYTYVKGEATSSRSPARDGSLSLTIV